MSRRGIKEFRAPEALALIGADREHQPLVCPSCGTRTIQRAPRRRAGHVPERVSLTCGSCGRHAFYIARGLDALRDATMDPRTPPPERAPRGPGRKEIEFQRGR